jgi:hypothetical protein
MNFIANVKQELESVVHESEVAAFVAGIFLQRASGSIQSGSPDGESRRTAGYHIEFPFDDYEKAQDFSQILAMFEMFPKLIGRKDKAVVYLKSGECLCNLLALVGANRSLMELHNEIALRQLRNVSNRRANCDTANIEKQVATATQQIEAIRKLGTSGKLHTLPQKLQDTAQARLDNPDASCEELGAILGITKSGIIHRLNKLVQSV